MSQVAIALAVLSDEPGKWVSARTLVEWGVGWRYSARIGELIHKYHWPIDSRPDPTRRSSVWEYRLVEDPEQTTLFTEDAA